MSIFKTPVYEMQIFLPYRRAFAQLEGFGALYWGTWFLFGGTLTLR
jgi:hypothetical protein